MAFSIGRHIRVGAAVALALAAMSVAVAPRASAQDRVYWTVGSGAPGFAYAALDGTGGGLLATETAGTVIPEYGQFGAFTIDTADGRFYWFAGVEAKTQTYEIESVRADGSDQRLFDTGGVEAGGIGGMSIDPAGRRLIWSQQGRPGILSAALGGGGGGALTAPGIDVYPNYDPAVFDPGTGRVYWPEMTYPDYAIDWAAIDGSGGKTLPIGEAAPRGGIAVDDLGGRVYWVSEGKEILSMRLDGTDLRPLAVGTAPFSNVRALAIDEATRTLYWANSGAHAISFAKLDGSGATGQLNLAGAPPGGTEDLNLFVAPRVVAAPTVSGLAFPGQTIACSPGEWAPDQPQAKLFDAAVSVAYQWSRDGAPIPGATGPTLTVPAAGASYACTVTASNAAGSTTATSDPLQVPAPPPPAPVGFGASTAVTLALASGKSHGTAIEVAISNYNSFAVSGTLTASARVKGKPRPVALVPVGFGVGPGATTVSTLRLPQPLRKQLRVVGKLRVNLATTVVDPVGVRREVGASVVVAGKRGKAKNGKPRGRGAGRG
jgi:hypothetical protein